MGLVIEYFSALNHCIMNNLVNHSVIIKIGGKRTYLEHVTPMGVTKKEMHLLWAQILGLNLH